MVKCDFCKQEFSSWRYYEKQNGKVKCYKCLGSKLNTEINWHLYIYRLGFISSLLSLLGWIFLLIRLNVQWEDNIWKKSKNFALKGFIDYFWYAWGWFTLVALAIGFVSYIFESFL